MQRTPAGCATTRVPASATRVTSAPVLASASHQPRVADGVPNGVASALCP